MPLLLECGEHEEVPFVSAVELDVGRMGRSTTCCRYIVESGALRKVQVVAAVVSDMGTSNKYDLLLLGCFEDALAKSALPTHSAAAAVAVAAAVAAVVFAAVAVVAIISSP